MGSVSSKKQTEEDSNTSETHNMGSGSSCFKKAKSVVPSSPVKLITSVAQNHQMGLGYVCFHENNTNLHMRRQGVSVKLSSQSPCKRWLLNNRKLSSHASSTVRYLTVVNNTRLKLSNSQGNFQFEFINDSSIGGDVIRCINNNKYIGRKTASGTALQLVPNEKAITWTKTIV